MKVHIVAGYCYTSATRLIEFLIDRGFSVDAKCENSIWTITAIQTRAEGSR